jgi:protein SCO1/2
MDPRISSIARLASAALAATLAACAQPGPSAPVFTLIDDAGAPWALSAQRGSPVVLTFGFTHCADTCPETLAKLAHLRNGLGADGRNVRIVMVSVDPRRDTPAVLHRFVERFNGPIVGLTGAPSNVAGVESAYHVWAQRVPGRVPGRNSYDVVHSAVIYFIDPGGTIRDISDDDAPDATLSDAMRKLQ